MKLILKLAWRNVWRNWRRTTLTILAIVFGTMLAIVMYSYQVGTYEVNIEHTLEMYSGFLQIQKNGYAAEPSINKCFPYSDELVKKLNSEKQITGFAPRITGDGLIGYKENSEGVIILGIDCVKERKVSLLHKKIKEGMFIDTVNKDKIVIGYKLLKKLDAKIGDTLVILASGLDGTMGNMKVIVGGAIKMGTPEIDGMSILMNITTANELMSMNGKVNIVAVSLKNFKYIPEVQKNIQRKLSSNQILVLNWEEFMPDFKSLMESDTASNLLFLILLLIVVTFGILNTILMSVNERFREFGIMLSLGTKNFRLVTIVFFETIFISLIGIIIANIISWGITAYIVNNPIRLGGDLTQFFEEYGFEPMIYSTLSFEIFSGLSLFMLLVTIFTFIYPAYRIFKLEPLKGIRYT